MTDSEPTEATSPVHDESLKEGLQGGSAGLKFLPVNQFVSPAESTRQRAYLSCDACRQRKTRCVPSGKDKDKRHPCQRCVADNKPCHFRNSRAVGVRRRTGSRKKLFQPASPIPSEGTDTNSTEPTVEPYGVTDIAATSEGTGPPFHPHATSLDSPRDPVLSGTLQSMEDVGLGSQSTSTASPKGNTTAAAQPTARRRIITTRLHDTADALDLLTLTAAGVQSETPHTATRGDGSDSQPCLTSACSAATSSESWPRATNETDWKKVILIKKGVLTKLEVIEYLDFYFNVLWPLRPIVHGFYSDRTRYALLAVEEPLLLTCLVTLASRYHTLQGPYGQIRSERIHWQAWKFLQKYLQSALWGSPLTRSPGAIVAMLLMIEWHSKSINNPLGLSDSDDYELFNVSGAGQNSTDSDADTLSSSTNRQRYGMTTLLEKLNIVAPAYRSNKMSWMLLSNAIALAQEGGCFEHNSRELQIDSSIYETFKQSWNQLICVFIYLADESLSMRLGLNALSPGKSVEAVRARFSSSFASLLPESLLWESYYDLTIEAKKARELLQSLKKAGPSVAADAVIPELEHLERGLSRWRRQHEHSTENGLSLLRACVELEYQYLVMYSLAPASHIMLNNVGSGPTHEGPIYNRRSETLAALANRATSASREMLNTLVDVLEPSTMLKYVPVRCWQFIVAANLHLLKATLVMETVPTEANDDVRLLRTSILAIRNGSPDDTHMAVRYARFLEVLLDSSHYSSRADTPAGVQGEQSTSVRDGLGISDMESHSDTTRYMMMPNDSDLTDVLNELGNVGDLVNWAEDPFGRLEEMGFLPNV